MRLEAYCGRLARARAVETYKARLDFELLSSLYPSVICETDLRPKTPEPTMRMDDGRGAGFDLHCIVEQCCKLRSNLL